MTQPREIDEQTEKHIERFLAGKEVWNEWARDMLTRKEKLDKQGKWQVSWGVDGQGRFRYLSDNDEVQAWLNKAYVDFSTLCFQTDHSPSGKTQGGEVNVQIETDGVKSIVASGSSISFDQFLFPSDITFQDATFQGEASFWDATFKGEASFQDATFKGGARFWGATFQGEASFWDATFKGEAGFQDATFKGEASFQDATFKGGANFLDTTFKGEASFQDATFMGEARFSAVDFLKTTSFANTQFNLLADFEAIEVKRAFSLADAQFLNQVPNFSQAHFAESPRLDHVLVRPKPTFSSLKLFAPPIRALLTRLNERTDLIKWPRLDRWRKRFLVREYLHTHHNNTLFQHTKAQFENAHERDEKGKIKRSLNDEAYYRALKRLAIQAHDHENEMKFFAGELRARRFVRDFPYQKGVASALRYWAGVLYEITSDFGRSLWRPAAWWGVTFALFASLYFANASPAALEKCRESQTITPFAAANTIAAKHSLPFFTMDRTEKLKRSHGCLYGAAPLYDASYYEQQNTGQPKAHSTPKTPLATHRLHMAPSVPGWVTFLGVGNMVLSLVFLFLLLLAIRNQFRIK